MRCFAVDCEPLGRRQLLLITGLPRHVDVDGMGLAVIVPTDAAYDLEDVGRGRIMAPMPGGHALVTLYGESIDDCQDLEALTTDRVLLRDVVRSVWTWHTSTAGARTRPVGRL